MLNIGIFNMNIKNIALITSTIRPDPNVILLKRTNPEERLSDYQNAFRFYCTKLQNGVFDSIVYVDNSGYPLDSLKDIAHQMNCAENVEFISYTSTADPTRSRFYLEMNLIDHAIKVSEKINLPNNQLPFVWKITGRYLIENIAKIVSSSTHHIDLYINVRDYPDRWADFFLVGFNAVKYSSILGSNIDKYCSTEDGERVLRQRIDNGDFMNYRIVKRFNVTPKVIGVRGYDAKSYNNLSNNAKYYARVLMNYVLPDVWI